MVERAEDYPYSSHRAYIGMEPVGIIDVDPVLRLFGSKRKTAQRYFAEYVAAGAKQGSRPELYETNCGILGSEEFVDATIHRLGETGHVPKPTDGRLGRTPDDFDHEFLLTAVERVSGVSRDDFCAHSKSPRVIAAKEAVILTGRRLGATTTTLAALTGLSVATISRRHDAGLSRMSSDESFGTVISKVMEEYTTRQRTESRESKD